MKITENQKRDQAKYYLHIPDADFSPKKNKDTINRSIARYEKMRNKKKNEFNAGYGERADAVVTYLRAIDRGGVSSRLDHFFTPNQIRQLRGDDIRAKVMEGLTIIRNKNRLKSMV